MAVVPVLSTWHPAWRYLGTLAVAAVVAVAAGAAAGVGTYAAALSASSSSDSWAALGAALLALAAGFLAGTVVYVVAVAVLLHRAHPPGRRVRPVTVAVIGPPAALLVASSASLTPPESIVGEVLALVAVVGFLVAGCTGIAAAGVGPLPRPAVGAGLGGLAVGVVAVAAAALAGAVG